MKTALSKSGLSIIAVVLAMLILALFGAVAVSIITTQSDIGLQEEQGAQAFYIAEGGMEYALINGTYCNYNGISGSLGEGGFGVSSVWSNATMSGSIDATTDPVTVYLTVAPQIAFLNSGFTLPGAVGIDSEMLFCTGAVSNSLTGCSRGFANSPKTSHNGSPVEQCAVRSTGTVSKGLGFGGVKRIAQVNVVEVDE